MEPIHSTTVRDSVSDARDSQREFASLLESYVADERVRSHDRLLQLFQRLRRSSTRHLAQLDEVIDPSDSASRDREHGDGPRSTDDTDPRSESWPVRARAKNAALALTRIVTDLTVAHSLAVARGAELIARISRRQLHEATSALVELHLVTSVVAIDETVRREPLGVSGDAREVARRHVAAAWDPAPILDTPAPRTR